MKTEVKSHTTNCRNQNSKLHLAQMIVFTGALKRTAKVT